MGKMRKKNKKIVEDKGKSMFYLIGQAKSGFHNRNLE